MLLLLVPIAVLAWLAAAVFVVSLCAMAARSSAVEPEELAELERERPPRAVKPPPLDDLVGGLALNGPRRFG
jgi:hypothetical protein